MNKFAAILLWPITTSEKLAEFLLFKFRLLVLLLFAGVTALLLSQALNIRPDASFIKMIPDEHPYVENYLQYRDDLAGLGNSIRVVVAARDGDIFSADFQTTLKQVTDELFSFLVWIVPR